MLAAFGGNLDEFRLLRRLGGRGRSGHGAVTRGKSKGSIGFPTETVIARAREQSILFGYVIAS